MDSLKIISWYEVFPDGDGRKIYAETVLGGKEIHAENVIEVSGREISVEDAFLQEEGCVKIGRRIRKKESTGTGREKSGIAFGMDILLDEGRQLRYGIPSCRYSSGLKGKHTYMEERLTAPMVMAYVEGTQTAVSLARTRTPECTQEEERKRGDSCFLHRTLAGSLGYEWRDGRENFLCARWPYEEMDSSVALDSKGTPVQAFYPVDEEAWEAELHYEIQCTCDRTFTDSLYERYQELAGEFENEGHQIVSLPFTLQEEIICRETSLMKSYREFGEDGAGFFFHFDPRKGYGSEPSGFGTSFNTIPHSTYVHILEYGFTGRQNHAALILARDKGGEWVEKGRKVVDFFLNHCILENGWVYSLYDLSKEEPFFSFGDPEAPKLHYMDYREAKGNYLRTMTEPMNDVLECYKWYHDQGSEQKPWLEAVIQFADLLVSLQNGDGSWYRAYEPDGTPVFMLEDPGMAERERERGRKAASAIPIVFLCNLAEYLRSKGEDADAGSIAFRWQGYQRAAVRAGEYVLSSGCREELFQGGTLDNPNVVDKEAAQYAMAGCWHLFEQTGEKRFLDGSVTAARQFVTWNYIWNAPVKEETLLCEKKFRTKGMGAINSIWCGGVVDIYSLFHIRELYLTGRRAGDTFLMKMADWISTAAHQIMSWPGDKMGFTDIGMQPEGFGICPQGMDEGMIQKGDIWGTLGWIYSAGIDGVDRYVKELRKAD